MYFVCIKASFFKFDDTKHANLLEEVELNDSTWQMFLDAK